MTITPSCSRKALANSTVPAAGAAIALPRGVAKRIPRERTPAGLTLPSPSITGARVGKA